MEVRLLLEDSKRVSQNGGIGKTDRYEGYSRFRTFATRNRHSKIRGRRAEVKDIARKHWPKDERGPVFYEDYERSPQVSSHCIDGKVSSQPDNNCRAK